MFRHFSDIEYKRPDLAAALEENKAYLTRLRGAKSFDEAKALYLEALKTGEAISTMYTVASIRHDLDTRDKFYAAEMDYYNENMPAFGPLAKEETEIILSSPFLAEFKTMLGEQAIREMEATKRLESEAIVPDRVEEAKLSQEYSEIAAQCVTEFDGETCNFYGLLKHMQSTNRDERRRAFESWAALYESVSAKLDGIYDKLVAVRVRMAKKLGFKNYIEMAYLERGRFDYKPEDVARFRSYVRDYVTPACAKLFEKQKARLGIDALHYYDEALLFPEGNENPQGDMETLVGKALDMYRKMSPETGRFFDFMTEHRMFDLESRPGKHMGGYCTFLEDYRSPFIFSNFNGTSADVDVLTHEAGHAFEAFTASQCQPLLRMVWSSSEINEIHSMTMEHFAYPYMESFFENADKYRYYHLTDAFRSIPYLVSVDEFQHRVFEKPEMTAEERYAVWREIEKTYMPWRDYDGCEFLEKGGFWMQKQHIFLYPFYYVDYALAQMCAFQYYDRMKTDRAAAWADYYRLCQAGGSRGYFELLGVGKLDNPFREETVRRVVSSVMADLEAQPF